MPLIRLFKARQAFRRSKRLKGRPEWQDVIPETKQGRDAYKIADKYQARFARAFMDATKDLLSDPAIDRDFKRAYETGSILEVLNSLPLFAEGVTDEDPVWKSFQARMSSAYRDVIQAAGTDAMDDVNQALDTNLKFAVENEEPEGPDIEIKKAKKRVAAVPINPYSARWMKTQSLQLITEGIKPQQIKVINRVLSDGFAAGVRAEDALGTIRENIGLTGREYSAVGNRRLQMEAAGFGPGQINAEAAKYTAQLTRKRAERIARTETIRAQAQGRSDAWRVAQDEGALPPVTRVWLAPPPSPNPDRPCEICLELDGLRAPVGGMYESSLIGAIEGPPAHPMCRCTETLVRT